MLTVGDDDFRRQIQQDTGIKPEWPAEAFSDLGEDVRHSIARIQASPFIPEKGSVRGFVYDVQTGRLREVTCLRGFSPALPLSAAPRWASRRPQAGCPELVRHAFEWRLMRFDGAAFR
jgi:hypothetical protein